MQSSRIVWVLVHMWSSNWTSVSNVDVCVWMCQILENYWKQLWVEEKQSRGSVSQTINIGVEYCSYISLSLKSQSFSPIPKRPLLILLACSIAKWVRLWTWLLLLTSSNNCFLNLVFLYQLHTVSIEINQRELLRPRRVIYVKWGLPTAKSKMWI